MAHPTRREVLIGGVVLFAVAATGTSDLTTPLNALPLPENQGEFFDDNGRSGQQPGLPSPVGSATENFLVW
jgi:hypothetical protein